MHERWPRVVVLLGLAWAVVAAARFLVAATPWIGSIDHDHKEF
jgi:hypothetical protein